MLKIEQHKADSIKWDTPVRMHGGGEAYKSPTRNQIVNGNPDRNKYKNKKEQL